MIAYQVLLNASIIPPLIALEEPERNLHPAALKEVANILEKLSERTQVLVTTHSSQILDFIDTKKLDDKIGIKLLSISPATKEGTVIKNLEEYIHDKKSLQGWIQDFGIGSAIFESDLIPTN
jgi:predicted ATP-dependent endonuclease of OLD family